MSIDARVLALEQQVQALMGRQDQLTPNVLSLGPKGEVNENLTGKLEAKGIVFPEAGAPGTILSEIQWQDATATVRELITGYSQHPWEHRLVAEVADGEHGAALSLRTAGGINPDRAEVVVDGLAALLLDGQGGSHFAQLGGEDQITLKYGVAGVTWPGATETSNVTNVAHGVANPVTALYYMQAIGSGGARFAVIQSATAASANVYLESTSGEPPAGNPESFYWLAIVKT